MTLRVIFFIVMFAFAAAGTARAQDTSAQNSVVWKKVHASIFATPPLHPPTRSFHWIPPSAPRTRPSCRSPYGRSFPQTKERYIEKIWLIVDNNPSPIAAVFNFTLESGRADIETRIRVEEYTYVRVVALTNDGKLSMVANYVKASGGCSAPASKDAVAAKANLGKMRVRVVEMTDASHPALAQLMISHPNDSGLAMDQVTRSYATPHFVRSVEIRYGGKLVMNADVDFSISENPNFRFYFVPEGGGELDVKVVDNQDLLFTAHMKLDDARLSSAARLP